MLSFLVRFIHNASYIYPNVLLFKKNILIQLKLIIQEEESFDRDKMKFW